MPNTGLFFFFFLVLVLLDVIGGCSLRLLPTPRRPPAPSPSCPTAGPPQPGSPWAWSAEASKQVRRKPITGVQIRISEQPDLCPESSTVSPLFTASCGGKKLGFTSPPISLQKKTPKKFDVLGGVESTPLWGFVFTQEGYWCPL